MAGTRRRRVAPTPATDGADPAAGAPQLAASYDVECGRPGLVAAREFVRGTLGEWALEPRVANAAVDVAHELVSNAVQHAAAPIVLRLYLTASMVTVAVTDASAEPAKLLPYRAGLSECGLGLRLVTQLSREWGQRVEPEGKTVWATVRRTSRGG